MTLITPPSWLQNGSYPAESDRLTMQALYATTGVIGSNSLAVSPNSPAGMSVIVSSGWAAIVGTTQPDMGTYVAYNNANTTLTVTTADATNPRIDIVCVTVRDAYYSGAYNDVIFQVIAGTPASSPVAPTLPDNSILLANIAVGAGVTSITAGNITDERNLTTTNLNSGSQILVNNQTGTSYTPVSDDAGKLITLTNTNPITVTIPPHSSVSYSVGTEITFARYGTGAPTIQGGVGVTILSTGATTAQPELRAQYSVATAVQTSLNTWLVTGDIQ